MRLFSLVTFVMLTGAALVMAQDTDTPTPTVTPSETPTPTLTYTPSITPSPTPDVWMFATLPAPTGTPGPSPTPGGTPTPPGQSMGFALTMTGGDALIALLLFVQIVGSFIGFIYQLWQRTNV